MVSELYENAQRGSSLSSSFPLAVLTLFVQILRGEREPMLIEYICPEHAQCGGLADRMMGMVTTFMFAVISNRAISLTWEQPLPIDMILDSPFVDWSHRYLPHPSPARHPIYDNQTLIDSRLVLHGRVASSDSMFWMFNRLVDDEPTKQTPWVQVRSPSFSLPFSPFLTSNVRRSTPSTAAA
jgi:hypothetical protein